jgi:hypothetical protein
MNRERRDELSGDCNVNARRVVVEEFEPGSIVERSKG